MKVLVIGFPKTGTKSMHAALTLLGYNVYDYQHNFHYLSKDWIKILTKGGTKEDFYRMYKDVDASVDYPACLFWEEILEAFPNMKLIFMQRKNEEEWLRSWERQAKSHADNYLMKSLTFFSPTAYSFYQYVHHTGRVAFCAPPQKFYQAFEGISPTVARKRYRDHNATIQMRAPMHQMLDFKLSDGWGPLCKFLDKYVPDAPFPHKNKGATILDESLAESPVFIKMQQEMKVAVALLVVGIGFVVYLYMNYF